DLIWFPTGGGKTEAYLALAAFEMILRRLRHGVRGGGTAVLTRYTLRMLTAQQFQRASTLICALERMRKTPASPLAGKPQFTIGLWVGGETTPNKFSEAQKHTKALLRAQTPENPFQIDVCPWCGTPLIPSHRLQDDSAYGFKATRTTFVVHCTHVGCEFYEALPVQVVDEQIFAEPPTLRIATVDKFARLPWVKDAGSLLGRGDSPFIPPGLVIQDELHLLSGPLGTTVALYEAAVLGLIAWDGTKPKVVASTATIRAASEQVRRLYGSPVTLFPPSGIDADDSFFATLDGDSPGRLYLGLMPQAHTQSYATVLALTALLEAPGSLTDDPELLDAYWTVVAYHNSLRELGRTVTIARDDVSNLLSVRAGESPDERRISRDGVIELTSSVKPGTLVRHLARLEQSHSSGDAVDVVASTNMLSVGIDISRLGVMLMNGQPKMTSEYIQATSRVGRSKVPGLVVTLLRASKPRDRSHYETFRAYHEALYKSVEPTSVTPWSPASRDRSLHAALVMLVRHGCGLRGNDDAAHFRASDRSVSKAVQILMAAVHRAEPDADRGAERELNRLTAEWDRRAEEARLAGQPLKYESSDKDYPSLLKDFGERKDGWDTMHSMRSVDRAVRVVAQGESL
ncbi:MAG: helicase-related protein, partial [Chloroflexota bacterium]